MLAYNLKTIDDAKALVRVCEEYSEYFKTDIVCGHYVVDGSSLLGVCSMCPNIVDIRPILPERLDVSIMNHYHNFLKAIGQIGREHLHIPKEIHF